MIQAQVAIYSSLYSSDKCFHIKWLQRTHSRIKTTLSYLTWYLEKKKVTGIGRKEKCILFSEYLAWLNYISFQSNREVIRCSFSIWQNDEFPHWSLHWSVNVFNKLHSTLKLIHCGEGVAAGQLLFAFVLLLMQPCQISLTLKPSARERKMSCEILHIHFKIHMLNPILIPLHYVLDLKMSHVSYSLYQIRHSVRKQCLPTLEQ